MNMKGNHLIIVLIAIIGVYSSPNKVQAQSKTGTTVASFLTLGNGARGSALGHAYTASASGADALFWNVAGSAIPTKDKLGSVVFSNFQLFAGIDYNSFGVVLPVTEKGVLGLNASTVNYGTMLVRTGFDPEGTGEQFSASDLMIGLSYAQPLSETFYMGGQVKWISQRIWDMKASTIAIDIGLTLVTDYVNGMRLSASIQNFGGRMQLDGINIQDTYEPNPEVGGNDRVYVRKELDSWNLPLSVKFGLAAPVIKTDMYELTLMGESHQTNDQKLNADFGGEFTFKTNSTNFSTRVGYRDLFLGDEVDGHLTYGAGFDMALSKVRFGFDFAISQQNYLQNVQMIDFRIYF